MREPPIAPVTLEGWYVLHQFFRVNWPALRTLEAGDRRAAAEDLVDLLAGWEEPGENGWSGAYGIVGGGTDYLLMHFRPSLEALGRAERAVRRTALSPYLDVGYDYLSVVELGLYGTTVELVRELEARNVEPYGEEWSEAFRRAAAEEREKRYVQRRLEPIQPEGFPYVCFYPMDKRRGAEQNWYRLGLEERGRLMSEHGTIGRRYVDRISQVISGSIGLDDWEWGVTLFAGDPLDFKVLVTEMRYDEVSARYAEFGAFFVGKRIGPEQLVEEIAGDR